MWWDEYLEEFWVEFNGSGDKATDDAAAERFVEAFNEFLERRGLDIAVLSNYHYLG